MLRFKNYKLVLVFVVTLLVVGCIGPLKPQILLSIQVQLWLVLKMPRLRLKPIFRQKESGFLNSIV